MVAALVYLVQEQMVQGVPHSGRQAARGRHSQVQRKALQRLGQAHQVRPALAT